MSYNIIKVNISRKDITILTAWGNGFPFMPVISSNIDGLIAKLGKLFMVNCCCVSSQEFPRVSNGYKKPFETIKTSSSQEKFLMEQLFPVKMTNGSFDHMDFFYQYTVWSKTLDLVSKSAYTELYCLFYLFFFF